MKKKLNESEIKDVLLGILNYFDSVCKKNDIHYSLGYGTLIGAARHKGFIPWDDDIDVIVPQDDYLRLLKLPEFNGVTQSRYLLHTFETEEKFNERYSYPFAKLMDEETSAEYIRTKDVGGAFIDVFPVTGLPKGQKAIEKHFDILAKNRMGIYIGNRRDADLKMTPKLALKEIRRLFYALMYKRYIKNLVSESFAFKFNESDKVAVSVWNYGIKEVIPRRLFDEYDELLFEGKKYSVIKNYDEYLRSIYGNWRELPPIDQQVSHHEYHLYYKE